MSKKFLAFVTLGTLLKANGPGSNIKTISPGSDISSDASIDFFENLKAEMLNNPGFSEHDFIMAASAAQEAFTNGAAYRQFIDVDGKIHFDFMPAEFKDDLNPESDISKIEELIRNLTSFIQDNIGNIREMSPLQQLKTILQVSGLVSCFMQIGRFVKATCSGLYYLGSLTVGFFKKIYNSASALNTGPVPAALTEVYDAIETKKDEINDNMTMSEAIHIIEGSVSANSLRLIGMNPQNVIDASAELPTVLPSHEEKRDEFYDPSTLKKSASSLPYGGKRTKRRKSKTNKRRKTNKRVGRKSLRKRSVKRGKRNYSRK